MNRIDRAKSLLIKYNNITEEEYHRIIEKDAMNKRVTSREVVDKIIERYGV
ncbi:MAG: ANTAR domain-containing protein [Clostridium sp.]|uniref:ANTAR domain-containing protein n=1 Tax=Clostridium sp. TaxID=1506 RepID=UPI0012E86139|nr:ANTAR domain-containing protein [Clostridium sp.]MBS5985126.1 ANTAR domain-containing protein [Clostridium sp.]